MTSADHSTSANPGEKPAYGNVTALLSSTLDRLEQNAGQVMQEGAKAKSTLGDLLDALDERAFGLLILLLALPCCVPFIYVIPQIVAVPMLALAAQLAMGRHEPWFPQKFRQRSFEIDGMRTSVRRTQKYLGWLERFAVRRLTILTTGVGVRFVGALMLIPTASILVPLPSTNTVPGIGVAIASVGLMERDGILVILGLLLGLVWVAMLGFFGLEAIHYIKGLILGE